MYIQSIREIYWCEEPTINSMVGQFYIEKNLSQLSPSQDNSHMTMKSSYEDETE